jgi:tetratricopeptide (TPR) repeat protein
LLVIVAALAYYILRPTKPERMTGEFNVAVADFNVLDAQGKSAHPEDGRKLSDFVYLRLQDSFAELGLKNIRYEIWGPDFTGTIQGSDRAARETAVKQLAEKIGAHVVIYGTIQESRRGFELLPEFYVNYQGFSEAGDITGEHELGAPLAVKLPFASNVIQDADNPALSARATALSLLTIGLTYYSIDDHAKAIEYFDNALETEGWLDTAGKQVGYLLLGNAYVRRASISKTTEPLAEAARAYDRALVIDSHYARALVGQAGVTYLLALGDPKNPSLATADQAMLDQAEAQFLQALAEPGAPASANIPAKVHLWVAQINLVRGLNGDKDALEKARGGFQEVVAEFREGNSSISEMAALSFGHLGLIARLEGDTTTAIENYKEAVNLASPFYQGKYSASLGEVYLSANQHELAVTAYEDALRLAESLGDAESADKYRKRLEELKAVH